MSSTTQALVGSARGIAAINLDAVRNDAEVTRFLRPGQAIHLRIVDRDAAGARGPVDREFLPVPLDSPTIARTALAGTGGP